MKRSPISLLLVGLMLATTARAELAAPLAQAATQIAAQPAQRQLLARELEDALKAGVREQDLQAVLKLATTHKYAAADTAAFVQKLAAVRRDDLPIALVRDKILEGMAKQVPGNAILGVTSLWQDALKGAHSSVQAMEERGLKFGNAGERDALLNLEAGLRQRYGANEALASLTKSVMKNNQITTGAESLIAAGTLAELLLLHKATVPQALELPEAGLKAGYTSTQIQALQRSVLDQLRQGVAPADLVANIRHRQFGPEVGESFGKPSFAVPGQTPGGAWPAMPGGGFPSGGGPAGAPGGGFPSGGGPSGAPGSGFPSGGGPSGAPGGGFMQGRGG